MAESEMRLLATVGLIAACSTAQAGEISDLYKASGGSSKDVQYVDLLPMTHTDHGITEIGIEHTPCLGTCPIYTLVVKSDGTFRYDGGHNVEHKGARTGKIQNGAFDLVAQFIKHSGYMQLKDGYDRQAFDIPTTYTMVVMNGQRKVVMDQMYAGPSSLWATEVLISHLLDGATWD